MTLKEAAFDLSHFLIVFMIIFFNYALGGHLLFGGGLQQWSKLDLAVGSTFRALVGDFAFEEMQTVAPLSSLLWFWTFMLLVGLVMLNMLLALVLDVYSSVKENNTRSESLWEDAVALWIDIERHLPKIFKKWGLPLPKWLAALAPDSASS